MEQNSVEFAFDSNWNCYGGSWRDHYMDCISKIATLVTQTQKGDEV